MEKTPTDQVTTSRIKTFVFLDLETSGIDPIKERPKMTEICLMAIHREALLSSSRENDAAVGRSTDAVGSGMGLPRVVDKLSLCVYPNKQVSDKAFEMTKLDSHSLSQSSKKIFDGDAATMLKLFISRQEGPVCLVAHYGDNFDFRLLRTELQKIGQRMGEDILCADSLEAYKATDGDRAGFVSYALGNIYRRVFGGTIPDAHHAEADVKAMIRIMLTRAETMSKWMDKNAVLFNDTELYYFPSPSEKRRCTPQSP
ncbi:three prime repair exonuclease 2-like [Patiria miniata]|uniref:Exonuclease domain-containing protein n=1 Tax=Patiria miniata TaxID=46514 RepID=A0A913Z5Y5_PATMI|nr:three prime repair exonuclease 2-like [Patiria miniata]